MPKYNHQVSLGFTIISDTEDGSDITPKMLDAAVQSRLQEICSNDDVVAAIMIEDTDEEED